jgi:hypothetical protein
MSETPDRPTRGGTSASPAATRPGPAGTAIGAAEEVVDAVGHMFGAFARFTGRAAKKGFSVTRNAVVATVNVTTGFVPKGARDVLDRGAKAVNIRQLFRMKHTSQLGNVETVESESDEEEEISAAEKDVDIEELFKTVLKPVDPKFFDGAYEAGTAELKCMPPGSYNLTEKEVFEEMANLDLLVKERQSELKIVDNLLKKRIIAHYAVFLQGVCQISGISQDLRRISADCKRSRTLMADAKRITAGKTLQMALGKRRKDNMKLVQEILLAVEDVKLRHERFHGHLKASRFRDAIQMTQWNRTIRNQELLKGVKAVRDMLQKWEDYCTDNGQIMFYIDSNLTECLSPKFNKDTYIMILDAYLLLSDDVVTQDRVIMSLWEKGSNLIRNTLKEVSSVHEEQADLATLAKGVLPANMIHSLCKIGERMLTFALLYTRVLNTHTAARKAGSTLAASMSTSSPSSPSAATAPGSADGALSASDMTARNPLLQSLHPQMCELMESLGRKLAMTLQGQLLEVIKGLQFESLDLNICLHSFSVAILTLEASAVFYNDADEMAKCRDLLKSRAKDVVTATYQAQRGVEIIRRMAEDKWVVDEDVVPEMFKVVLPISPDQYRKDIKAVKTFVTKWTPTSENPFMTESMLIPQDLTKTLQIKEFEVVPNRAVVTSTSAIIANRVFEYLCRVVVRFPPLASEVLTWCEEMVALYFYTAAANFVSTKRALPFTEQQDFLPATKVMMNNLKVMSLRCAQQYNKKPGLLDEDAPQATFPPSVFQGIQSLYASAENYYATGHRLTAIESVFPLIQLLGTALESCKPLLIESLKKQHSQFLEQIKSCAEDVLRVGCFRLASACFSFQKWVDELGANTRFEGRKIDQPYHPSKYVPKLLDELKRWTTKCKIPFPSHYVAEQFWIHFVMVLIRSLMRGYARAARTDLQVNQMKGDLIYVHDTLKEIWPISNPRLIPNLERSKALLNCFSLEHDKKEAFVKEFHRFYCKDELVGLLGSTVDRQKQISDLLEYLRHDDVLPEMPVDRPPTPAATPPPQSPVNQPLAAPTSPSAKSLSVEPLAPSQSPLNNGNGAAH